jgi:hypothetical protein
MRDDPKWGSYYDSLATGMNLDVAIRRVPVNLLWEGIAEYGVGALRAAWDTGNAYWEAYKGVKLNEKYNINDKEFKQAFIEQLKKLDPEKAATIVRCFRKGMFGMGLFAAISMLGVIHFGGLYHKGQKRKKDDELGPGEVMVGDTKMGKDISDLLEHMPFLMPSSFALDWAKTQRDNIESGKSTVESSLNATWAMAEAMQDQVPQTEYISPLGITSKVATTATKGIDYAWAKGEGDVDADGNIIKRMPLDMTDRLKLLAGRRGNVLTEDLYKMAVRITDDYARQIRDAYKKNKGEDEIERLKKLRDDAIKKIYDINKQPKKK